MEYKSVDDFEDIFEDNLHYIVDKTLKNTISGSSIAPISTTTIKDDFGQYVQPYLDWLVQQHRSLELPGIPHATGLPTIDLERVYVALRGEHTSAYERAQSQRLVETEIQALDETFPELSPQERRDARARYFRSSSSVMPTMMDRDRSSQSHSSYRTITLAEAFCKDRWLVILGDPGSGKTTLARWLTLNLARTFKPESYQKQQLLEVPRNQIDPDIPYDLSPVSLGPTRFPVLVRISDYAEELIKAREAKSDPPSFAKYLGTHKWLKQVPMMDHHTPIPPATLNAMILHYFHMGQAVLILDGMDEITGSVDRVDIITEIKRFTQIWINGAGGRSFQDIRDDRWQSVSSETPGECGGNQLVVTSRIAGYHAAPLNVHIPHVTIEPMQQVAVEHFCDAWMRAYYENDPDASVENRKLRAEQEAEGLKAAIYKAGQPDIPELASNPLLVTILALVYRENGGYLPSRRVELYQLAMEILAKIWKSVNQNVDELVSVLAPLAAFIHERFPTGLIDEREMRPILVKYLAAYRNEPTDPPHPAFNEYVDNFLDDMRNKVGLLAARGEAFYGFLHLTFQEYLAARHLVHNEYDALQELKDKLYDPRWRVPIILALGYTNWKWQPHAYEQLLQQFINADQLLGRLLPHATLIIVQALPEIDIPENIVRQIVKRLLEAYTDRENLEQFPSVEKKIEQAFVLLRRGSNIELVDECLCDALLESERTELAPAVATLLLKQQWFTSAIVDALIEAQPRDDDRWGWPIDTCLRQLVTPELPQRKPQKPNPLPEEQIRELRQALPVKLKELVSPERRRSLEQQVEEERTRQPEREAEYAIAYAYYESEKADRDKQIKDIYFKALRHLERIQEGIEKSRLEDALEHAMQSLTEEERKDIIQLEVAEHIERFPESIAQILQLRKQLASLVSGEWTSILNQTLSFLDEQGYEYFRGSYSMSVGCILDQDIQDWELIPSERYGRTRTFLKRNAPPGPPLPPDTQLRQLEATLADCIQGYPQDRARLIQEYQKKIVSLQEEWETIRSDQFAYEEMCVRYKIAKEAYAKYQTQAQQAHHAELSTMHLGFRRALEQDRQQHGTLMQRIADNPMWLRQCIALYGGFHDYQAATTQREYADLAYFLSLPDNTREQLITQHRDYYVALGGNDDTVYNIAVYLDEGIKERIRLSKVPPVFDVTAMYRHSPLSSVLLSAFKADASQEDLVRQLWEVWRTSRVRQVRVDAIIALVSAGEEVVEELEVALNDPTSHEIVQEILLQLKRVRKSLEDPVTRAVPTVLQSLQSLELPSEYWVEIMQACQKTILTTTGLLLDTSKQLDASPDVYKGCLRASEWCRVFSGNTDDVVYQTAVILDKMPTTKDLISLLVSAYHAPNLLWGRHTFSWPCDSLPYRFIDDDLDIPLDALDALEQLHINHIRPELEIGLHLEAIKRLWERVEINPNLKPELLGFILRCLPWWEWPSWFPSLREHPVPYVHDLASSLSSPYHKARALMQLIRNPYHVSSKTRIKFITEARAVASTIPDSYHHTRILEQLIQFEAPDQRANAMEILLSHARAIQDPDQKVRALARLALSCNPEQLTPIAEEAIETAALINSEYLQAETLCLLEEHLASYPQLVTKIRAQASTIQDPWFRAKTLRRFGTHLMKTAVPVLQQTFAKTPDAWSAVLLAAAINDVLSHFEDSNETNHLWGTLAQSPDLEHAKPLLVHGATHGLVLTRRAALTLDILINENSSDLLPLLLPLMHQPTSDAVSIVEGWLHHSGMIAHHATLFLAEHGRVLTTQTMPGLLSLLNGYYDRSRYRAWLTLSSSIWSVEKERRNLSTSTLGYDTLTMLGRIYNQYREENAQAIHYMNDVHCDLIHDNSEHLFAWATEVKTEGPDTQAALFVLRNIEDLSANTWVMFLETLKNGSTSVKRALLESICNMTRLNKIPKHIWEELAVVFAEIDNEYIQDISVLMYPHEAIIQTVRELHEKQQESQTSVAKLADDVLSKYAYSFTTILNSPLDKIEIIFNSIGSTFFHYIDGSDPEAENAAAIVEQEPHLFPILLQWLIETLRKDVRDDHMYQKCKALLTITAEITKLMPSAFANHASARSLEPLLIKVLRYHEDSFGRRAAITLLSYLRRVSPRIIVGLQKGLMDTDQVHRQTLSALKRFHHIDGDIVPDLALLLSHDSTTLAYGAAQLLVALGQNEKTLTSQRRNIVVALANALISPLSFRGFYLLTGSGKDEDDQIKVTYIMPLRQVFFQSLLDVTGVL